MKTMLSSFRLNHSKYVMYKAVELANRYGVDANKAALAGFTHDIVKEFSREKYLQIAKDNNIIFDEFELENEKLMHAKIGAWYVKEHYGFDSIPSAPRWSNGRRSPAGPATEPVARVTPPRRTVSAAWCRAHAERRKRNGTRRSERAQTRSTARFRNRRPARRTRPCRRMSSKRTTGVALSAPGRSARC